MITQVWPKPPTAGGQRVDSTVVLGDVIQVQDVGGNVTVTTDRPPYWVESWSAAKVILPAEQARAQPSRLLLARHQTVQFIGRDAQLRRLAEWMGRSEAPLSVQLVYAAGGQGKTRLAAHMAVGCAAAGWAVWRVTHTPVPSVGSSRVAPPSGGGVLALVDYADRWPTSHLLALLSNLQNLTMSTTAVVRVLLLARSARPWWTTITHLLDSQYGIPTSAWVLPPLGEQIDREELYRQARQGFADAMGIPGIDNLPSPPMPDDAFAQVLTVHMAALVGVDAHHRGTQPPSRPHALSAYLLRRERAHWHQLHARAEDPRQTSPEVMGRAVYIATLTGAMTRHDARTVLRQAEVTEPSVDAIIDDHRFCYPPGDRHTVLQPLYPDRLGEDFFALTTPGHAFDDDDDGWQSDDWAATAAQRLLTTKEAASAGWGSAAITVLVETAHRWPHVAFNVLFPLLEQRPELAMAAGGATLTRLIELPFMELAVLEAIEAVLPEEPQVDLDVAAAALALRLIPLRLAFTTEPADQARLHVIASSRLASAGRWEQALAAAQNATDLYRRLAEDNWGVYGRCLAGSLNNLGNRLADLGRSKDALTAAQNASDLYRRLAEDNPQTGTFDPDFARSLSNLASRLSDLGRHQESWAAEKEAVNLWQRLAENSPDPGTFDPDFARSLSNLASRLSKLGQHQEALGVVEEAVDIRRRLAENNRAVNEPDLALSLANLAVLQSDLGQLQKALPTAEDAVGIYRRLAKANPAVYERNLAQSLTNLGTFLVGSEEQEKALILFEDAVDISQRLARSNPSAHEPDLVVPLFNLARCLADLGEREEALARASEAVGIARRLAENSPVGWRPRLAKSLCGYAEVSVKIGAKLAEASEAIQDSISIYEPLVVKRPQAFAAELLRAYHTLADVLDGLGHPDVASEVRRRVYNATAT
ncbi:tetratricopeptide repeat protein [Streptomyces sp. AC550_RSS872]|uniref:tetratricopeptide repeat protein n=1 Tax=Streptomyces sp. AC550_RSS872 TaxID=2823689 RepID=UPI001C26DCDA|nr:tetratricopeptide repeat protein [Streptomyces sp. AC550_RSS872]